MSFVRIAVAAACAGNVMLLAVALYAGWFSGIDPQWVTLFRWASLGLGLTSLLGPGRVFFAGAIGALRTRTPHMDLPIALGLGAGGVSGAVNVVLGRGEIYFDSLTVLVFLLLLGRFIQRRQSRRAEDAVALLHALTPLSVSRVRDDPTGEVIEAVPVDALVAGDVVEVSAGASIPVDGDLVRGTSAIDLSLLTGEPDPVPAKPGDTVWAGAVNLARPIRVRTTVTGSQTRVGRLLALVERSTASRAPIVRMADRLSGAFVTAVLVLAGLTYAAWSWTGAGGALDHAVALLIVACPCALGLATPLALAVAVRRAADRDVLVKGGAALEGLTRPGTLLLDKTGTLTEGRTRLVRWEGDVDLKPLVGALEGASSHHVARALHAALADPDADPMVDDMEQGPQGIAGRVGGRALRVGTQAFVGDGARIPERVETFARAAAAEGLSPVYVAVEGEVRAAAAVGDRIRDDAGEAVARLQALGWDVRMLSGDHEGACRAVAKRVGIPAASVSAAAPLERKVALVEEALARGPVVMVGDGVNDAAALAAATVGVAVKGGAEASLSAASVYIARPGVLPVAGLIDAAHRTVRLIRRALAASLLYNATAVSLAAAGLITPLLAAALMPASSITVIALVATARPFAEAPRPVDRGDRIMSVLYIVLPLALGFAGLAVWAFRWAAHSGQLDDLDTPAHRMLVDDEG